MKMKRWIVGVNAVIVAAVASFGFSACDLRGLMGGSSETETEMVYNEITENGEVVGYSISGTIADAVFEIPSEYHGLPVLEIEENAFGFGENVSEIVVPDSVTSIGYGAFNGCRGLTSISLPFVGGTVKQPEDFDQYPFGYIFGTASYEGGTKCNQNFVGDDYSVLTAVSYCLPSGLKNVTVRGGNLLVGAFFGCIPIENVTVSEGVTAIGALAFAYCNALTDVSLPDSITEIGEAAFYNCGSLASLRIPDGATSFGASIFENCESLDGIVLPDGLAAIPHNLFYRCSSLTNVTIPQMVAEIGDAAFYGTDLQDVYFTGSEARWHAIAVGDNNTELDFATIHYNDGQGGSPDGGSTENNGAAGEENTGDSSGNSGGNQQAPSANDTQGLAFTAVTENNVVTGYSVTSIGTATDSSIRIPATYQGKPVIAIGAYAFQACTKLTSVTVPDSVTVIGAGAFNGCVGLKTVDLGSGLQEIGEAAFEFCSSLTDIVIPDSTVTIGNGAFDFCTALRTATIGSGVRSIGEYAFSECNNLISVTFKEPQGWYVAYYGGATSGTSVSSAVTGNASSAASYLTTVYCGNYWLRG